MKMQYDASIDAWYIELTDARSAGTVQLTPSTLVDVDEHGKPIGVEILDPHAPALDEVLDRFGDQLSREDITLLKGVFQPEYPSSLPQEPAELQTPNHAIHGWTKGPRPVKV